MNEIACEKLLELVCDRLDGAPLEIDPATIEAHLHACPACRAEAAKLMKDDALLKALKAADSTALEKSHVGDQQVDAQLIQRIIEKLQALPHHSADLGSGRPLSDQDLEWLSAAGTSMPPADPWKKK
jgi:anti-sigma factor RsiW